MFVFKLPSFGFLTRTAAKDIAAGGLASSAGARPAIFSYGRLHRPHALDFVPADLQTHIDRRDGTTTWSSAECGDPGTGDYLRRYANGKCAISLGTWWSKEYLQAALEKLQAIDPGDPDAAFLRDAIAELARREAVLKSASVAISSASS